MVLATAAMGNLELRHMEVYIDLSEDCQQFPAVGGRLNESIYGLVRGGRFWNLKRTKNGAGATSGGEAALQCLLPENDEHETVKVMSWHAGDLTAMQVAMILPG